MRLFLFSVALIACVVANPPESDASHSSLDASNPANGFDEEAFEQALLDVSTYQKDITREILRMTTTDRRISDHGYPVEKHLVPTEDGYILTLFRIPFSPKRRNVYDKKPVVFLQHGLMSSSDCWVLNGPNDALAFVLADAGYDVWMGNFRGNVYSRKHIDLDPTQNKFWKFSWDEIAMLDLTAMIDKVLAVTQEYALHYVGHSQGTTTFMVLLSSNPNYNMKFKTTHMLAPVGFMSNMQSPLARVAGPMLGKPRLLAKLFGGHEFMPNDELIGLIGSQLCADKSRYQGMCGNALFLMAGWDSEHLNYTLLPDAVETHPAGSSTSQVVHYLQEYQSGHFRKYDHGKLRNFIKYGRFSPPDYEVSNIHPETPVHFYYSDNDVFAAVEDVKKMAELLGDYVELHRVQYPTWSHMDFVWGFEIKSEINDVIVNIANDYEDNFNKINKI